MKKQFFFIFIFFSMYLTTAINAYDTTTHKQINDFVKNSNRLSYHIDAFIAEPSMYNRKEIETIFFAINLLTKQIKQTTDQMDRKIYNTVFDHLAVQLNSTNITHDAILDEFIMSYNTIPTDAIRCKFMLSIVSHLANFMKNNQTPTENNCIKLSKKIEKSLSKISRKIISHKKNKRKSRRLKKRYLLLLLAFISISIGIGIGYKLYKKFKENKKYTDEKFTQATNQLQQQQFLIQNLANASQENANALQEYLNASAEYQNKHANNLEQCRNNIIKEVTELRNLAREVAHSEQQLQQQSWYNKVIPNINATNVYKVVKTTGKVAGTINNISRAINNIRNFFSGSSGQQAPTTNNPITSSQPVRLTQRVSLI